ncbi:MAG TPA: MOSC N-terminal beta barrel domain-containing protein [Bryobacteraceae bacterium]|nr:MOSC N-terminal beta barrel domain-containing protein [Bryobacteraceae bacterium]
MKPGANELPHLSRIFVYPIKSARGIEVTETRVGMSGPLRDRRWMLVNDDGLALTQRTLPKMVLMAPRFEADDLIVDAPDMPSLQIRSWAGEGEWIQVRIWDDDLRAPHPDRAYSDWFSSFLGQSCRLVHLPDAVVRPVEAPYHQAPWRVSLADAYPLLVLGQASLDLLNEKLDAPVAMERFRPNLVVAGCAAHEEDIWARVRVGGVELATVKQCARCAIPLVDPATAQTGIEPMRTLAQYRKVGEKVKFGQNALVITPGLLRVGATVETHEAPG